MVAILSGSIAIGPSWLNGASHSSRNWYGGTLPLAQRYGKVKPPVTVRPIVGPVTLRRLLGRCQWRLGRRVVSLTGR